MNKLRTLFGKSLLGYAWQEFLVRYRFKYVLPKVREAALEGIRLDLSRLSLKVRNRILMGIYESAEKQLCQEFLRPGDSVLEIGGAIGYVGLVCQKKIGIRNYYVFEANPETLGILRSNYELNGLPVSAWNLALAPSDGPVELEVGSDFWEHSLLGRDKNGTRGPTVTVPGASFRTLLRQLPRPVNTLIIDVEGAEQFIDPEDIPREVEKMIIELHPAVLGAQKTYDLIAGLIHRGYYVAREEGATLALLKRPLPPAPPAGNGWQAAEREPALAISGQA